MLKEIKRKKGGQKEEEIRKRSDNYSGKRGSHCVGELLSHKGEGIKKEKKRDKNK
jgi:hypothetical protein